MRGAFIRIILVLLLVSTIGMEAELRTVSGPIGLGTNPDSLLTISKRQTVATQVSSNPNCYFPISVYVNVTWTGPGVYGIQVNFFWLVVTAPNLIIGNSTISSFQNPNNKIGGVDAFSGVPVTLQLTFPKTCLPVGVSVLPVLFYEDGTYQFEFSLP